MVSNNSNPNLNRTLINTRIQLNQKELQKMSKAILNQIKKRIDEHKKTEPDSTDLDLSEIKIEKFTPEINALIQKNKKIQVLLLVGCGLKTLASFPKGNYVALDISKNELGDDSSLNELLRFPELTQVIFTNNKVEKLETVLALSGLKKLVEIDFEDNPVSKHQNYRKDIFAKFENLQFLDRKDKDGNLQPDEEEEEFNDQDDDDDEGDEGEDDYDVDDEEFEDEDQDFDEDEESDKPPKKGAARKKK